MIPRAAPRLAGFGVAAAAVLAFAGLAGEVLEGETLSFDRLILLALHNTAEPHNPIGPHWLWDTARDVTGLGGNAVLTGVTLAVAGFLALVRKPAAGLTVLVAVGGGTVISSILKLVFQRVRPDIVPHAAEVYTSSFPSGHAMLSAVTYLTIGALLAQMQPQWRVKAYILGIAILTTLLVGVSRVYLGVHWPTDVLAGWCMGSAWALLCWLTALSLDRKGLV